MIGLENTLLIKSITYKNYKEVLALLELRNGALRTPTTEVTYLIKIGIVENMFLAFHALKVRTYADFVLPFTESHC
jgi:hypothetical protein